MRPALAILIFVNDSIPDRSIPKHGQPYFYTTLIYRHHGSGRRPPGFQNRLLQRVIDRPHVCSDDFGSQNPILLIVNGSMKLAGQRLRNWPTGFGNQCNGQVFGRLTHG
jgi:hypothetical protein